MVVGPGLFTASDANKDGTLMRSEFKETFGKWFSAWDADKRGSLNEEKLRSGLSAALPSPNFGGPGGGRGGGSGPGGFGGGQSIEGVKLDPLIAATNSSKPLISKLLAVPALRTRYLGYIHDIEHPEVKKAK